MRATRRRLFGLDSVGHSIRERTRLQDDLQWGFVALGAETLRAGLSFCSPESRCSVVARFEDPESAYLLRRSVGVEAVLDRNKTLTCTWHGGRTVQSTSRVSRAGLPDRIRLDRRKDRIGRFVGRVPAVLDARREALSRSVGEARGRYLVTTRDGTVPSGSGLTPRSGLRRSTLALFVQGSFGTTYIRFRFTKKTPHSAVLGVGCSTVRIPVRNDV